MTHTLSICFFWWGLALEKTLVFVHFCCHSHVAPNFKSFYNCGPLSNLAEYPCCISWAQKNFKCLRSVFAYVLHSFPIFFGTGDVTNAGNVSDVIRRGMICRGKNFRPAKWLFLQPTNDVLWVSVACQWTTGYYKNLSLQQRRLKRPRYH